MDKPRLGAMVVCMEATTAIVKTANLSRTEYVQDTAKVAAIAAAMGNDVALISWDDQPAIIIDEESNILDGHHRVAAANIAIGEWRAIIVNRAAFDAMESDRGHTAACRAACDACEDYVTKGSL